MEDDVNEGRIRLIVMNETAYVWNVEDWLRLRRVRILGNFIGSLAALPRQDQIAGLPLALLNEEATLLLEKSLAVTVKISNISSPPDENVKKKCSEYYENLFSEQTQLLKEKRRQELEQKVDIILEGKRAKRRRPDAENLDRESVLQEELNKLETKKSALAIHISTEDPWLEKKDFNQCSWSYPRTDKERINYLVFKDLWERGYYITPGGKFGGDYLAYPGDPVKFHAFFIVICVEKTNAIRMNEIVVYGRLGQSVRKTAVLAYIGENDEVCYQSLQWSGF